MTIPLLGAECWGVSSIFDPRFGPVMDQTILYSSAVYDGAPPNRPAGEMNKTSLPPIDSIDRQWYVVDAENQTLGRLATEVASILRGKNNPSFTPHLDTGDFVVVVNAEKIQVSGKKPQQKLYRRHSGRPGGMLSLIHI